MAETYEQVLCVKKEVFVYRVMARVTNRGYRAADWKLDEPDWTGRLKVVVKDKNLKLRLEDKNSGELFAECPVESYPSEVIEQVLDSSRYFVIRIRDDSGRNAFIGIGFADRGDSFDLLVAVQDHFKQVKREEKSEEVADELQGLSSADHKPKLDLSLKQGQTIKLNLTTKKNPDGTTRPRTTPTTGSILLPPPPGASRVAPPPSAHPPPSTQPPTSNTDLLLQLDTSPTHIPPPSSSSSTLPPSTTQASSNPFSSDDMWEDFASAPVQKEPQNAPVNWVNFE